MIDRFISSTGAPLYSLSTNPATPMNLSIAISGAISGDIMWIKADGTYARTLSDAINCTGTSTTPILWKGYLNTTGDLDALNRSNSNGLLITTGFPKIAYSSVQLLSINGSYNIFQNLTFLGQRNGVLLSMVGAGVVVDSCYVINSGLGSSSTTASTNSHNLLINSDLVLGSGLYVVTVNTSSRVISCYITSISGGYGVMLSQASENSYVINNIVYNCAAHGILVTGNNRPLIMHNTIYGCSGCGIYCCSGVGRPPHIINNMITDNHQFGLMAEGPSTPLNLYNNYFRGNSSGHHNITDWMIPARFNILNDSGDATTDYTDVSSYNWNIKSSSSARSSGVLGANIGALNSSGGVVTAGSSESSYIFG